jgi:hypothetical protein
MGKEHGLPLLAYVLPVLRLLGTTHVEVPLAAGVLSDQNSQPLRCTPASPEGLPEGMAVLLRQACHEMQPSRPAEGCSLSVHVTAGSYRFDAPERESILEAIPDSPEHGVPPPDRGLLDLLRPLQEEEAGHLIAADWLEDWMGPNPASAALRASQRGPAVSPAEAERLVFHSFGWRWLGRGVVIYLAGAIRRDPGRIGKAGFLIGLLYGSAAGASRRWVRWLPVEGAEAARPLARELGVELIE